MDAELLAVLWVSLKVALVATLLILVPGVWLGHALARGRVRCRVLVQTLITLPMVLPPVAVGLLLLRLLSPLAWPGTWLAEAGPWLLTWKAAVLAAATMAFPLLVRGAEAGFAGVPARMEAVAAGLGMSRARIFWKVTLPLASAGVTSGVMLAFTRALGEFGATILVAGCIPGETETLALGIYARIEAGQSHGAWVLVVASVLIALLLGVLAERLRARSAA
ncbi:MAG: molybdate ABC transporter permease subunit [Planctomycetes bacterium]|nr:molybdate ABC transporter permease subunit [Planctomycetota bacterium]